MEDISLLLLRWINSFWSQQLFAEGKSVGGGDVGGGAL
jgi:hypothetical protein